MEEEALLNTGMENTYSLMSIWKKYNSVAAFLASEDYIGIRSTTLSEEDAELWLNCSCDIDGLSIEWERLGGTSHIFHHLYLAPRDSLSLKKVYPMLKKHDNLTARTDTSLKVLKLCVGTQLFYDFGWEYYLCLLPDLRCEINYEEKIVRELTLNWIKEVRLNMKLALNRCLDTGDIAGTLDKNNLNDVKKLFVLPSDSLFVLKLLDQCIAETVPPQGFNKCLFSFRFGEKNTNVVTLPIRDKSCVLRICVHSAVVIELADDEDAGLLWSRDGIRSVTGKRGTATCAMSFSECCNFQSNLDGRMIDISNDLRSACAFPGRVHFVQLYADFPHRYPDTRFHPVSAAIVIGRGLKAHSRFLDDDAAAYVSEIESNFRKIRKSKCRMEFVFSLPDVRDTLNPNDCIVMDCVFALLRKHALIVPFIGDDMTGILRTVGEFFAQELKNLLNTYRGSGQSEVVWQAYQYEIAVEKLLWGKPLCWRSNLHAVNLGVGLGYPTRSLTDARGFLCLANKFSCCVDEKSCPPLTIYTNSDIVQKQVQKMFGFEDYLNGSSLVLGRRLVIAMVEDFYDLGVRHETFGAFYAGLKQNNTGMKVAGKATLDQIADILCSSAQWKFPMISHHLLAVLKSKGKNLKEILRDGIHETGIAFFPAIRKRDEHGHAYLNWQFCHGVWLITGRGNATTCEETASIICPLIVTELESRKLCFTSKISATTDTFPWVLPVLKKLQCRNLDDIGAVRTLTFITCIVFIQSGRYVNYNQLKRLEKDMPLSQNDLRQLEILGKFLLSNVNCLRLWRLHHSLPGIRDSKAPKHNQTDVSISGELANRRIQPENMHLEEGLPRISGETENVEGDCFVLTETSKHIPSGVWRMWSSEELSIVGYVLANSEGQRVLQLYRQYVDECRKVGIPDRSLKAFERKVGRIREPKNKDKKSTHNE